MWKVPNLCRWVVVERFEDLGFSFDVNPWISLFRLRILGWDINTV